MCVKQFPQKKDLCKIFVTENIYFNPTDQRSVEYIDKKDLDQSIK